MKATYCKIAASGVGLGSGAQHDAVMRQNSPSSCRGAPLAVAGDNATRADPCEKKTVRVRSGISFRKEARRIGREVGLGNPRAAAYTLAGVCRTAYVQWLATIGVTDKHRAQNIEVATQCALASQKELTEDLAVPNPNNPKHLRFREAGDCPYKEQYSLLDEITLPHLRHIPNKRANSNKWERRKVVVWDHKGSLKPADLIMRAESAGVDLGSWLKVRKVNGSASVERANRLEIFCSGESVRDEVRDVVSSILKGVVEDECVRLGRTYRFRREMRATESQGVKGEAVRDNIYEILCSIPEDEGTAQTLCNRLHPNTHHHGSGGETSTYPTRKRTSKKKKTSKCSGLKVWTLNCQGVTSKAAELTDLVGIHKPDIIVLTETWLKKESSLNLHGYKGIHVNRPVQCARGEGGVAIYTKASLVARECAQSANPNLAWTKVHLRGRKPLLVGGFYGPQESAVDAVASEHFAVLSKELAMHGTGNVVLLGDFNAKIGNTHPKVGKFCPAVTPSRNGRMLLSLLEEHNLRVLNGQKAGGIHTTRHAEGAAPALLDLIITDMGIACGDGAKVLHDVEVGSDHLIVEATLNIAEGPRQRKTVHKRWNRERLLQMVDEARMMVEGDDPPPPTEFEKSCSRKLEEWLARAKLYHRQLEACERSSDGESVIEGLWADFVAAVNGAARETVGEKTIGRRSRSFIDEELRSQIKERRQLFNLAVDGHSSDAWRSYVQKRKEVAKAIFTKKRSEWSQFNTEIMKARANNPKRFWNLLKRLDKGKKRLDTIELNQPDGKPCGSNAEILELFSQHFATVGLNSPGVIFDREWQQRVENSNVRIMEDDSSISTKDHTLVLPITVSEIKAAAKDLSNGKATGRDGIPPEFLKYGGAHMTEALALLFDICRSNEYTPKAWHLVNMVPIFKKGDKYDQSNYRRISLLSCVYKLYARVLQRRLLSFLNEHIVEEQAGFCPGKGCDDNLCIMTDVMERKVANREPLYVALVDMRAAFDTVWRDGLWYKLQAMGVPHKLIRILQEIYSHGKFRVVANGEEGPDVDAALAGVLQGDVLSPDLFKAFINDLPRFLADAGCTGVNVSDMRKVVLLLFADDILLWGDTQTELQLQLDTLRDYCRLWQLEVSAKKTKVLLSPCANLDGPLLYDGKELEIVDSNPYLGVLFSGGTDFSAMIEKTVKKALARQSALSTILTNRQLPMLLRYTLWTTLVRPILEWGLEVYSPPDITVLESVQRSALRMIAGAQQHTPVAVLEGEFNARSMKERMDMRKSALLGKLKMASEESLLGQIRDQPRGKGIRGKKVLSDEFERLTKEILVPAGLTSIHLPEDRQSDPLSAWRDSVKGHIISEGQAQRAKQVRRLSSLSHLVDHGTDYSTHCIHPYMLSANGKAGSLWFKVRSNTLPLGRLTAKMQRHASDKCKSCGGTVREDLMHFLRDCPALHQVRHDWIESIKSYQAGCAVLVEDIPKFILGPTSALNPLPQESFPEKVAVVEKLLMQLWHTRNTLHFGSRGAEQTERPQKAMRSPNGCTREHVGGSLTSTSNDSHRLNANSSSGTANGYLTRARARLLLQCGAIPHTEHPSPSPSPITQQGPAQTKHVLNLPLAPRVQRSRSCRLESMEIISKT